MKVTTGQLLINQALPEDMRDYSRILDKSGTNKLFNDLATRYPDQYTGILHDISGIGGLSAHISGHTITLDDLDPVSISKADGASLRKNLDKIGDSTLSAKDKDKQILQLLGPMVDKAQKNTLSSLLAKGNPVAQEVASGARGNATQLNSMLGSSLLITDQNDRPSPVPITSSYAEGLSPAEYLAQSYGTRKGAVSTKLCLFEDTLVRMADFTVKKIKDIKVGDVVIGVGLDGKGTPTKVTNVFNNGLRSCFKFTFRINNCLSRFVDIVCTEDHKILAQVREGRSGSTYGHRSIYNSTMLPLSLAKYRRAADKNTFIAMPIEGIELGGKNEPTAFLYGLLLGDGCVTKSLNKGINWFFSCGYPELAEELSDRLAPIDLTLSGNANSYSYVLKHTKQYPFVREQGGKILSTSHPAKLRMIELGITGKYAHEKALNKDVHNWSNQSIAELIAGYFICDGSVDIRRSGASLTMASTSRELLYGIRELLEQRFGIWGSALNSSSPTLPSRVATAKHTLFTLRISHYRAVRRFLDVIPVFGPKFSKAVNAISNAAYNDCESKKEYGFKIQNKVEKGLLPTYDIEVENENHAFLLANGLIVSNSTAKSGYLGKQLALAAHKLIVSDEPLVAGIGFPVEANDPDNEGTVLAKDVGKYKAGTIVTRNMISAWPAGTTHILVRSPVSDLSESGGVPMEAAGIRERGTFPSVGENIGISAIQSISEKLSQSGMRVKHTGGAGTLSSERSGFKVVNQLVQVPKVYTSGAAHATSDGIVRTIEDAPQGGKYIHIGDKRYYVDVGQTPNVKVGTAVEAGDLLSDGLPNPAVITEHKGIGEGRRAFTNIMREVLDNSGIRTNRRNIELLARSIINHVHIDEADDSVHGSIPGDIVEYDRLAAHYTPRKGSLEVPLNMAKGLYLEKPVLHFSIGTRITPKVVDMMKKFDVKNVVAHKEPPVFTPVMQRAVTNLLTTPDWMERLGSFYVQKGFLDAVQRGLSSDVSSLSYIPSLVTGQPIGEEE